MPLNAQELAELKERVKYAHFNGFDFAHAAEYIKKLGGGAPPPGVLKNSTGHLLALLEGKAGKPEAPPVRVAAPEPPKPVVEPPKPEPVVEAKVEVPPPPADVPPVEIPPEVPVMVESTSRRGKRRGD